MNCSGFGLSAVLSLLSGQAVIPTTPPAEPKVERLGEHLVGIGAIRVDTKKKELGVPGFVNGVMVLEYLANARQGFKAYESALELDATAVEFNLALILLGLDGEKGVPSRFKFDPEPPQGDAVEVWVEWDVDGESRRIPAAELIYNERTKETFPRGPWVYTGSVFLPDGNYLAHLNGVLIGFMHTPESIVDSPLELDGAYGMYRPNPNLGLDPRTPVRVIVNALEAEESERK